MKSPLLKTLVPAEVLGQTRRAVSKSALAAACLKGDHVDVARLLLSDARVDPCAYFAIEHAPLIIDTRGVYRRQGGKVQPA